MKSSSLFSILSIPATLHAATVKRGYFQQLALHPPHQDPDGFRRLRAAYEALQEAGARAVAYLDTELDFAAEEALYRDRFEPAIAAARSQALPAAPPDRRFHRCVSHLSYSEAIRLFGS